MGAISSAKTGVAVWADALGDIATGANQLIVSIVKVNNLRMFVTTLYKDNITKGMSKIVDKYVENSNWQVKDGGDT